MLPTSLVTAGFFEALSHLFYAVSVADDVLVLDEKKAIHSEIKNYWVYNVDGHASAELMYAGMRQLIEDVTDDEEAFDYFKGYYQEHRDEFTMELKKAIYDSASLIADSYAGKNKSELRILAQLKLLFTK